jgi:orotate phosphoribosyltransferase
MYDREALLALIREHGLERGEFTLASGKKSSYYLDCRKVTLDSAGAKQIAEGILEMWGDNLPDAVGGMAIGADPISAAVITTAAHRGQSLKGFIVRKETKSHGKGNDVEGPIAPGLTAVVVEDVVTTGGSSLKAIERVEAVGLKVVGVVAVVDRLEGAAQIFADRGYSLQTLLTIRDFGIEPNPS